MTCEDKECGCRKALENLHKGACSGFEYDEGFSAGWHSRDGEVRARSEIYAHPYKRIEELEAQLAFLQGSVDKEVVREKRINFELKKQLAEKNKIIQDIYVALDDKRPFEVQNLIRNEMKELRKGEKSPSVQNKKISESPPAPNPCGCGCHKENAELYKAGCDACGVYHED